MALDEMPSGEYVKKIRFEIDTRSDLQRLIQGLGTLAARETAARDAGASLADIMSVLDASGADFVNTLKSHSWDKFDTIIKNVKSLDPRVFDQLRKGFGDMAATGEYAGDTATEAFRRMNAIAGISEKRIQNTTTTMRNLQRAMGDTDETAKSMRLSMSYLGSSLSAFGSVANMGPEQLFKVMQRLQGVKQQLALLNPWNTSRLFSTDYSSHESQSKAVQDMHELLVNTIGLGAQIDKMILQGNMQAQQLGAAGANIVPKILKLTSPLKPSTVAALTSARQLGPEDPTVLVQLRQAALAEKLTDLGDAAGFEIVNMLHSLEAMRSSALPTLIAGRELVTNEMLKIGLGGDPKVLDRLNGQRLALIEREHQIVDSLSSGVELIVRASEISEGMTEKRLVDMYAAGAGVRGRPDALWSRFSGQPTSHMKGLEIGSAEDLAAQLAVKDFLRRVKGYTDIAVEPLTQVRVGPWAPGGWARGKISGSADYIFPNSIAIDALGPVNLTGKVLTEAGRKVFQEWATSSQNLTAPREAANVWRIASQLASYRYGRMSEGYKSETIVDTKAISAAMVTALLRYEAKRQEILVSDPAYSRDLEPGELPPALAALLPSAELWQSFLAGNLPEFKMMMHVVNEKIQRGLITIVASELVGLDDLRTQLLLRHREAGELMQNDAIRARVGYLLTAANQGRLLSAAEGEKTGVISVSEPGWKSTAAFEAGAAERARLTGLREDAEHKRRQDEQDAIWAAEAKLQPRLERQQAVKLMSDRNDAEQKLQLAYRGQQVAAQHLAAVTAEQSIRMQQEAKVISNFNREITNGVASTTARERGLGNLLNSAQAMSAQYVAADNAYVDATSAFEYWEEEYRRLGGVIARKEPLALAAPTAQGRRASARAASYAEQAMLPTATSIPSSRAVVIYNSGPMSVLAPIGAPTILRGYHAPGAIQYAQGALMPYQFESALIKRRMATAATAGMEGTDWIVRGQTQIEQAAELGRRLLSQVFQLSDVMDGIIKNAYMIDADGTIIARDLDKMTEQVLRLRGNTELATQEIGSIVGIRDIQLNRALLDFLVTLKAAGAALTLVTNRTEAQANDVLAMLEAGGYKDLFASILARSGSKGLMAPGAFQVVIDNDPNMRALAANPQLQTQIWDQMIAAGIQIPFGSGLPPSKQSVQMYPDYVSMEEKRLFLESGAGTDADILMSRKKATTIIGDTAKQVSQFVDLLPPLAEGFTRLIHRSAGAYEDYAKEGLYFSKSSLAGTTLAASTAEQAQEYIRTTTDPRFRNLPAYAWDVPTDIARDYQRIYPGSAERIPPEYFVGAQKPPSQAIQDAALAEGQAAYQRTQEQVAAQQAAAATQGAAKAAEQQFDRGAPVHGPGWTATSGAEQQFDRGAPVHGPGWTATSGAEQQFDRGHRPGWTATGGAGGVVPPVVPPPTTPPPEEDPQSWLNRILPPAKSLQDRITRLQAMRGEMKLLQTQIQSAQTHGTDPNDLFSAERLTPRLKYLEKELSLEQQTVDMLTLKAQRAREAGEAAANAAKFTSEEAAQSAKNARAQAWWNDPNTPLGEKMGMAGVDYGSKKARFDVENAKLNSYRRDLRALNSEIESYANGERPVIEDGIDPTIPLQNQIKPLQEKITAQKVIVDRAKEELALSIQIMDALQAQAVLQQRTAAIVAAKAQMAPSLVVAKDLAAQAAQPGLSLNAKRALKVRIDAEKANLAQLQAALQQELLAAERELVLAKERERVARANAKAYTAEAIALEQLAKERGQQQLPVTSEQEQKLLMAQGRATQGNTLVATEGQNVAALKGQVAAIKEVKKEQGGVNDQIGVATKKLGKVTSATESWEKRLFSLRRVVQTFFGTLLSMLTFQLISGIQMAITNAITLGEQLQRAQLGIGIAVRTTQKEGRSGAFGSEAEWQALAKQISSTYKVISGPEAAEGVRMMIDLTREFEMTKEQVMELARASGLLTLLVPGKTYAQAIEAMGKAMGGYAKGLRELQVQYDEADIRERSVKMFGKTPRELTSQEQALVHYSIVMDIIMAKETQIGELATAASIESVAASKRAETAWAEMGENFLGVIVDMKNGWADLLEFMSGGVKNIRDLPITAPTTELMQAQQFSLDFDPSQMAKLQMYQKQVLNDYQTRLALLKMTTDFETTQGRDPKKSPTIQAYTKDVEILALKLDLYNAMLVGNGRYIDLARIAIVNYINRLNGIEPATDPATKAIEGQTEAMKLLAQASEEGVMQLYKLRNAELADAEAIAKNKKTALDVLELNHKLSLENEERVNQAAVYGPDIYPEQLYTGTGLDVVPLGEMQRYKYEVQKLTFEYNKNVSKMTKDHYEEEASALADYNDERAKVIDDFNTSEEDAAAAHQKRIAEINEDAYFELLDAIREHDALGILLALRKRNRAINDENESYKDDKEQRAKDQAARLKELDDNVAKANAARDKDFADQLAQIAEEFQKQRNELQVEHEQRLADLEKEHQDRLAAIDAAYTSEKAAVIAKAQEETQALKLEYDQRYLDLFKWLKDQYNLTDAMMLGLTNMIKGYIEPGSILDTAWSEAYERWKLLAAGGFLPTIIIAPEDFNPLKPGEWHPGDPIPWMAEGGNFWTTGPTPIMVGEAGPEFVSITPQSKMNARRGLNTMSPGRRQLDVKIDVTADENFSLAFEGRLMNKVAEVFESWPTQ